MGITAVSVIFRATEVYNKVVIWVPRCHNCVIIFDDSILVAVSMGDKGQVYLSFRPINSDFHPE